MQYNISNNEKGFSLIELMVVLVIVGILTGLMIPNISGFVAQQEINEAAQGIAGAIRSAKEIAITKNVNTAITINRGTRQYTIYRQNMPNENLTGAAMPGDATYHAIETRPLSIKGNIRFDTLGTLSWTALPDDTPIIISARGTANITNGGTIYLMPDREFAQNKQEKMRAITVSTATARVRIYTWNNATTQWE